MSTNFQFETYQVADISTKYITPKDGKLINNPQAPSHIACVDPLVTGGEPQGNIFAVTSDPATASLERKKLPEFGFSGAFLEIFKQLAHQNIPYVRFDADGGEIEGAPIFE